MTYSNLTTRRKELWRLLYLSLSELGYPFNPLRISQKEYLRNTVKSITGVTVNPYLSPRQMLEPLYDFYVGPSSERHLSTGELISVVVNEVIAAEDGTPDWVPDAFAEGIYIDLVGGSPQGRAWVAGTGEVAVSTLLGTDPATEAGWGATAYDAQYLTANGYVPPKVEGWTLRTGFIGAAKTAILAGSTCILQIKQVGVDTVDPGIFILSEEVNSGIYFDVAMPSGDAHANSYSGDLDETISNIMNVGADSLNRVAFTLTATRAEMAVNGSAHVGAVIDTDEFPTSGDDPISMALVDLGRDCTQALQFIGIKTTPLPTTAGLQALSVVE